MHPVFSRKGVLGPYLAAWIPLAGLLAALLALPGQVSWGEAIALAIVQAVLFAVLALSVWYVCRANPLGRTGLVRLILTHTLAAGAISGVWVFVGRDVASLLAMETISRFYKEHASKSTNSSELFEDYDESFAYHTNLLRQAVYNANRAVLNQSRLKDEYLGMGSTVAGMAIQEFTVSMINVGDSRLYLIRDGVLEQISRDHTLAEDQVERGMITLEEARQSQLRHILSSVIGVDVRIRAHVDELVVLPGDIFLLCTDGLTVVMEDSEIQEEILREPPGPQTLTRLIDEVNARRGRKPGNGDSSKQ